METVLIITAIKFIFLLQSVRNQEANETISDQLIPNQEEGDTSVEIFTASAQQGGENTITSRNEETTVVPDERINTSTGLQEESNDYIVTSTT